MANLPAVARYFEYGAIEVGGLFRILALFAERVQAVIAVVDFWIVRDELMSGLLGVVDSAGFDQIDDGI